MLNWKKITNYELPGWVLRPGCVIINIAKQFVKHGCMRRSAALTYATLLALVPLMTASFVLVKALPIASKWGTQIQQFIFSNFVTTSAQSVNTYLSSFAEQASRLSKPSIAFLFVTAMLLLYNIEQSLNDVWEVKKRRTGIISFAFYVLILTIAPVLLALGMGITTYLWSFPLISETAKDWGISKAVLQIVPYFLTFLAFSWVYWLVPNCKVNLRFAFISGFFSMVVFESAKYGFALYVKNFSSYELLYGAWAAIPLFLIWIYFSWAIILAGAVICHQLQVTFGPRCKNIGVDSHEKNYN